MKAIIWNHQTDEHGYPATVEQALSTFVDEVKDGQWLNITVSNGNPMEDRTYTIMEKPD